MNRIPWLILLLFIFGCTKSNSNLSREEELKLEQYRVRGKALYQLQCSNCHGPFGDGLARMYPPLKNVDWVASSPEKISCVIKNGISGNLVINGVEFSGDMPGHIDLTNLEIAEITSYVMFDLNESKEFYNVNDIIKQLENCDN